jgi:hypothetical protein
MLGLILMAVLAAGDPQVAYPPVGAVVAVTAGDGPGGDLGCLAMIDGVAYVAYCRSYHAEDPEGWVELKQEGRLLLLPNGTKVRVLEYHRLHDPEAAEVRVQEGPHKGRKVWRPSFYLLP